MLKNIIHVYTNYNFVIILLGILHVGVANKFATINAEGLKINH